MSDTLSASQAPEQNPNVNPEPKRELYAAYGEGENGEAEQEFALRQIQRINDALELRERNTLVFNGIPYTLAYLYNQQKGINYAPPRDPKDDREVSLGIVHEKIIAYVAVFLKYAFRRRIRCYDDQGQPIDGLGDLYDLAIEYSQRAEQFVKKIALIYWEMYTQGNAFVLEDWEVRDITLPKARRKDTGAEVTADTMDYTLEFLEKLEYLPGTTIQKRRAISKVLDGRMVIFGNPEIVEVQDQPFLSIEIDFDRADAEQLFGNLSRWQFVPKDRESILKVTPENITLFSVERLGKPDKRVCAHFFFDRVNNRYNLFLNGLMMLPRQTPMTMFYPRGNYPLTNFAAERLTGSIYARSVPAKTKFNADFVDWALKNLALKFEQGVNPAILAKGKYTLSRKIFRAGEVTHGVTPEDYAKADPDNKGVTPQEFKFFDLLKEIIEEQTFTPTTMEEIPPNSPAESVALADQNQRDKLAFLLDGLANGFMDLALRRAETIESKYTIKQKQTYVGKKKVNVYQNFTIDINGVQHNVVFDDTIADPTVFNHQEMRNELHKRAFKDKKNGKPTEYYLVDPAKLREGRAVIDIEIVPERLKDTQLQLQAMWQEFTNLLDVFGANVNIDELKSIYLETRGRPASIFNSADVMKLQQIQQSASIAQTGKPSLHDKNITPTAGMAEGGAPSATPAAQPVQRRKTAATA